jgi:hypothetical protein
MERGLLEILPNELITNILAILHHRDLASCTQVRLSYLTVMASLVRTGVQTRGRDYPKVCFTPISPRTRKMRYGRWPSEHSVYSRA